MIEVFIKMMAGTIFMMVFVIVIFAYVLLLIKFISWLGGKILGIETFKDI